MQTQNYFEDLNRQKSYRDEEMRVFTPDQVAEILQLPPRTIREHLRQGKLKGVRVGRHWRIPEKAVNEYLNVRVSEIPEATKKEWEETLIKPIIRQFLQAVREDPQMKADILKYLKD
jgi:excisionase family DNA binding protein